MGAQTPNMYRFLLLAAALCAAASAFPAEQPMDMDMGVTGLWNAFKIDFNKVYSPEEEAHRLVAFKDNVETIYRHNAEQAPTQGWTMGINEYSDMSSDEFSAMQGFRAEDKPQGELVHLNETDVPATVDWTTKGAVNPIKNQGQCGSCWAFGTVASVEGINAIKNKKLVSLSEQQLVNCDVDGGDLGCKGGLPDNAFKYVESTGLTTESNYPYTSGGIFASSSRTLLGGKGKTSRGRHSSPRPSHNSLSLSGLTVKASSTTRAESSLGRAPARLTTLSLWWATAQVTGRSGTAGELHSARLVTFVSPGVATRAPLPTWRHTPPCNLYSK